MSCVLKGTDRVVGENREQAEIGVSPRRRSGFGDAENCHEQWPAPQTAGWESTGMAFLKRANGETAGQIIELKADRIIIGRSPEHCHVVLDPNGVSRRHAEIYRKAEEFLPGRPQLAEHDQGQQHQGHSGHRSSLGRPEIGSISATSSSCSTRSSRPTARPRNPATS